MKQKDRHFDTTDVIEAELRAVMNTFTEQDFKNAFKNDRCSGNGAYTRKATTSWVMVASRPRISFDQKVAPVLEIVD
jgi:hypothetical protein